MHVMCRSDVNLMFCIKISATIHAQLYKHCWGDFNFEVLQLLAAIFCTRLWELKIIWKIKFQKGDSKIPTLLLCCCLHTKGRSSKPLASPRGLFAVKKNTEKQLNTKEGNSRAGGPGTALADTAAQCVSCAMPRWILHTWMGKVGRGASPSWDPGAQAALPILDRAVAKGEAERLSGQMVGA